MPCGLSSLGKFADNREHSRLPQGIIHYILSKRGSQERTNAGQIQTIVCGLFKGLRISLRAMVGIELRKARRAVGLTQEQLASKAKLHPTYIGLLERDKRSPSLDVFLQLCAALEISPLAFLKRVLAMRDKKLGK